MIGTTVACAGKQPPETRSTFLPRVALVGSVLGLASRLNSIPNLDNVFLAAVATIVSGIVPFCFVVGCVFLAMVFYGSSIRSCLQAFYALLSILAVAASYFFGRGLAF